MCYHNTIGKGEAEPHKIHRTAWETMRCNSISSYYPLNAMPSVLSSGAMLIQVLPMLRLRGVPSLSV